MSGDPLAARSVERRHQEDTDLSHYRRADHLAPCYRSTTLATCLWSLRPVSVNLPERGAEGISAVEPRLRFSEGATSPEEFNP